MNRSTQIKEMNRTGRKLALITAFAAAWVAATVLLIAGCGSDDSDDADTGAAASPTAGTTAAASDPLVGEWLATNECEEFVAALDEARLEDFAAEMVPGVAAVPSKKVDPGDPCHGTGPLDHSHSFAEDGTFASFDEDGRQVDNGTYEIVEDGTFVLSRPPHEATVEYRVSGDEATFDVVPPDDCKTKSCRFGAALGIATFFPRSYDRVN